MEKVIDKILEGSIDLVFRIILAVLVIVIVSLATGKPDEEVLKKYDSISVK